MEKPTLDQCIFFYTLLNKDSLDTFYRNFSPSNFTGYVLGVTPLHLLEETTTMNKERLRTLKSRYYYFSLPKKWQSWIENAYYIGDITLKELPYSTLSVLHYLDIKRIARNSGLVSTRISNNALSVEWRVFLKETLTEENWDGIEWVE